MTDCLHELRLPPQQLVEEGPIIDVTLSPIERIAKVVTRSPEGPKSAAARFLIDTGSTHILVDRQIPRDLGVPPIDTTELVGVSGIPELCPVYRMNVSLRVSPGWISFPTVIIGRPALPQARPFSGLLGRDFLRLVTLVYDGTEGRVAISVRQ